MHRRSTDAVEREIADWERIQRALSPNASSLAIGFIENQLERLREERAVRDRPKVWGRRATDPKPTILALRP